MTYQSEVIKIRDFIYKVALEQHKLDKEETFVYTEIATEGIATAIVANVGHRLHGVGIVDQSNAAQTMSSTDMKDRRSATRILDSIKTVKDLVVIINKYKARVNVIYDLIEKRDRSIKGFHFS